MKKVMIVAIVAVSVSSLLNAAPMLVNKTNTAITARGIGSKGQQLCLVTISTQGQQDLGSKCNPTQLSYLKLETVQGSTIGTLQQPSFNTIKTIMINGSDKTNRYSYTKDGYGPFSL